MPKQVEIVFDEKSGKFVVHFSGVPVHEEEHRILDQIIAELKKHGFDVETEHFHEKPRLPEFDEKQLPEPKVRS